MTLSQGRQLESQSIRRSERALAGLASDNAGRWRIVAAGLLLATVSIAAATASSFAAPAPIQPMADGGEWRRLTIAPIAEGSQTGLRAAPQASVERLAFKPERRARPVAALAERPIDTTPLRYTGEVGHDLYASLRAAGVPDATSADYVRALATRTDLSRGLGIADRFDLIVDHQVAVGGKERFGRLLFAGLDRFGAGDVMLLRWSLEGKLDWVDAAGLGRQSAGMAWPVAPRVSSSFGMRQHPLLGFLRFHRGIDLKASWGEPIRAAADGRVTGSGWAGGYGRQVRIAHAGGLVTTYGHMSRLAATPGQIVRQGQLIGYVGSSGLTTGPHLHYEVYKDGRPVNPASVRFASVSKVGTADREAFRDRLRQLLTLKPSEA